MIPPALNPNLQNLIGRAVSFNPNLQPILQPAIDPQPIPYRDLPKLNALSVPWRDAGYSTTRSPSVQSIHPWVSQNPLPNEEPNYLPPVEIVTPDVPNPVAEPFHVRRPPHSGEKELKVRTVKAFRSISTVFNPLTEGKEVVDILYSAIPRWIVTGKQD